jgi:hypothetical protein
MSRYPVKRKSRTPRNVEKDAVEVIGPAFSASSSLSFRYSYTEISALGGKAHVRSRKTRFEDGKLTSEAFEGEVDRTIYDQMVSDAQHYFVGQTALFLKSLSLFLPFSRKQRSDLD